MTAAVTRFDLATASATFVSVESGGGGFTHNRDGTQNGTTAPTPIPVATGNNYSWYKTFVLDVTTISSPTTTISNRRLNLATAPATGLKIYQETTTSATWAAAAAPAADNTSANGTPPSGYTTMVVTTSNTVYDSANGVSSSTGRNGNYVKICLGVGFDYVGGPGTAIACPAINLLYDEL